MISNGLVTATGNDLRAPHHCDVLDATGMILMPGLVDLRADLLSEPLPGFPELNAASRPVLGEEAVIWSGFAAGLRALRSGTTCVFAMQSAPGFALGALPRLREVLLTLGLRGVLAYRAESGREGAAAASRDAALYGGGEQLRMAVGCGDAATAGPMLKELAALSERCQVPFFAEVGMQSDAGDAVAALREAGVIGPRAVLAVGGGLAAKDAKALAESGATLVHVPNEDLAAGRALASVPLSGAGLGSGLGTADVLSTARMAVALARGRSAPLSAADALEMIRIGHRTASRVFGLNFGSFEPGSVADFVLWRYTPSLPLTAETLVAHVLEGLRAAQVEAVIANGRFVIRDGRLQTVEEEQILFAAQRGAIDLHQRITGHEWPGLGALQQVAAAEATRSESPAAEPTLDEALESAEWDDDENAESDQGEDEAAPAADAPDSEEAPAELMDWPDEADLEERAEEATPAAQAAADSDSDTDADEDSDDDADDSEDHADDDSDDDSDEPQQQSGTDQFGFGVFS